jgi:polysaccharide deacetylase family protein (PEP-CTERM system associated)
MNLRSTGGARPRPRANAITVDVEEWFHICGFDPLSQAHWECLPSRVVLTTRTLLDELDRAGARATFFVLGWVAERYPGLIGEIRAGGHDIGSHGHLHLRAYDLDADAFVADVRQSIAALRAAGVERIDGFRAPEWSINDRSLWALECLVREGITLDASMAPVRIVGRVDYPRKPHVRDTSAGPIFEVPPLVVDRFGHAMPIGWGWGLRMTSPRRMVRTIEAVNAAGLPAVLTVHPWEIDPEPPHVSLPPRLRFAHYFCLSGFRERLATILSAVDFGALSDVPALQASCRRC